MRGGEKNILLFDGVCNLCNKMVQFIIKRDPKARFQFASLQSEPGQLLLKKLKLPMTGFNTFVLITENKYYVKSSAVLQVLKRLGGIWKLFYVFVLIPVFIRDFIYNAISKSRYRVFGKRETCMIPGPGIKERFLDG
jgi:predicted DCC family thiol-disulfide oxidoreductase YuxK